MLELISAKYQKIVLTFFGHGTTDGCLHLHDLDHIPLNDILSGLRDFCTQYNINFGYLTVVFGICHGHKIDKLCDCDDLLQIHPLTDDKIPVTFLSYDIGNTGSGSSIRNSSNMTLTKFYLENFSEHGKKKQKEQIKQNQHLLQQAEDEWKKNQVRHYNEASLMES